jgi:predicted transcriptional regulator
VATINTAGQATGIAGGVVSISASSGSVNATPAGLTVIIVPSSVQTGTTEKGTQHY